jgi:hypothetical protein
VVDCLKSLRAALLSQDTHWEGAFAPTHTLIVTFSSPICLLYWLGTCVNFIPNSEWSIPLFCWLFAPCFSAIYSLQECSSLFEELKGGAAFAGYVVGRHLCMHPYFDCCLYFFNLLAVLAGHLCEFHTKQ